MSRIPDAELISRCLAGEARAWDSLIQRYEALIYSLPVRMGLPPSDAADVFQEVCLLLFKHLRDLRNTERLASWLISTTKREVWRHQRKNRGAEAVDLSERLPAGAEVLAASDPPSPGAEFEAEVDRQLVRLGVEELNDRCRELLTLLYLSEPPASYSEVTERLSMPLGSIGPTRARCLQRLHRILQEMGF